VPSPTVGRERAEEATKSLLSTCLSMLWRRWRALSRHCRPADAPAPPTKSQPDVPQLCRVGDAGYITRLESPTNLEEQ
jgi:hypothetical protein